MDISETHITPFTRTPLSLTRFLSLKLEERERVLYIEKGQRLASAIGWTTILFYLFFALLAVQVN